MTTHKNLSTKTIGVAEVKRNFSEVLLEVSRHGEHFIVEKKGKPMIALVNLDDFESIRRIVKPSQKKGLPAAIGACCDHREHETFLKDPGIKNRELDCIGH